MAHFARVDENGIVVDVIKVSNSNAPDPAPDVSEPAGQEMIAEWSLNDSRLQGTWIQTSYSGSFRKQYAGFGYRYDAVADVFIEPQPFPSWTLDSNFDWQPPIAKPTASGRWVWDETTTTWVAVEQ